MRVCACARAAFVTYFFYPKGKGGKKYARERGVFLDTSFSSSSSSSSSFKITTRRASGRRRMNGTPPPDVQLENVYDVWIAMRSKLRGYSTVIFDRLQRVVFVGGGGEEKEEEENAAPSRIRSVVFVRGSGKCVGKAIQVAEYVQRRFVGGTVYRSVTIGMIRAGERVFYGHNETMQPSFPRDRPMISIGLSLDRTRLMETMDLLEQVEQNMMHRSRPKECRRAQHKSIKVPLDGEDEDEEEEEEEEEEGEEEEEEEEEEEKEEEGEEAREEKEEEEKREGEGTTINLLNESEEWPQLQRQKAPLEEEEVVQKQKEGNANNNNNNNNNGSNKEEEEEEEEEETESSQSSESDQENFFSPAERHTSSYRPRRRKELHGEKTARGSSTPSYEKHV